jgi:hypothetical protein
MDKSLERRHCSALSRAGGLFSKVSEPAESSRPGFPCAV